jgi:hypothetical protein
MLTRWISFTGFMTTGTDALGGLERLWRYEHPVILHFHFYWLTELGLVIVQLANCNLALCLFPMALSIMTNCKLTHFMLPILFPIEPFLRLNSVGRCIVICPNTRHRSYKSGSHSTRLSQNLAGLRSQKQHSKLDGHLSLPLSIFEFSHAHNLYCVVSFVGSGDGCPV